MAGSAYTAVRYPEDRFYLTDDGKSEPLLDALYFLPAADCASQLKLVYTAYDSGGTQLGTGELTVRVTSKQSSAVFSDVNAGTCAWAADAVDFMNGYGLIQGADASTFNWRGSMTRGDLILILYRSAGSPAVSGGSLPFTDVSESDYAYDAVVWAWKNGVAGGVERDGILHEAGRHARAAGFHSLPAFRKNRRVRKPAQLYGQPPMSAPTLSMRCAGLSAAAISREAARS